SMIPEGSDLCLGCRHQFREPAPVPTASSIPGVPPPRSVARSPTFRVGTAMVLIAVVALCFGAISADPLLGVLTCLILLPASFRVAWISASREAGDQPLSWGGKILSFITTAGSVLMIVAFSTATFFVAFYVAGVRDETDVPVVAGLSGLTALVA